VKSLWVVAFVLAVSGVALTILLGQRLVSGITSFGRRNIDRRKNPVFYWAVIAGHTAIAGFVLLEVTLLFWGRI
jgi:predicted acyltransferase